MSSVRDNKIEIGFSSSKPLIIIKFQVSTSNTKSSIEGYDDITIIRYKIISDNDLVGKELELNKNFGKIEDYRLVDYDFNDFKIDGFQVLVFL
jgi:hypothetical protein